MKSHVGLPSDLGTTWLFGFYEWFGTTLAQYINDAGESKRQQVAIFRGNEGKLTLELIHNLPALLYLNQRNKGGTPMEARRPLHEARDQMPRSALVTGDISPETVHVSPLPDYQSGQNSSVRPAHNGITRPWLVDVKKSGSARLRVSIDDAHNAGDPIDRKFDLPRFAAKGKVLTNQVDMRQGIIMRVDQHIAQLKERFPGEEIIAYVGHGNLLANYSFILVQDDRVYCLSKEPIYERAYDVIVAWKNGRASVDSVFLSRENGNKTRVLRKVDSKVEDITEEIDFATSGQPLVRYGKPTYLGHIAEQWYDQRHLIRPVLLALKKTELYFPTSQLREGRIRTALHESVAVEPVSYVDEDTTLPLTIPAWFKMSKEDPDALSRAKEFLIADGFLDGSEDLRGIGEKMETLFHESLRRAGYKLVNTSRPLAPGEARFLNDHLEIHFTEAVYPHNVFIEWPDGDFGFVMFPGMSAQTGATLPFLQQYLKGRLHVKNALLLDNGGDVRLHYRGIDLIPQNRKQIRAILALTAPEGEWVDGVTVQ